MRNRRRALVGGLVVLLLVASAGAGAWLLLSRKDNPFASPETVALPPVPTSAGPTSKYLAGANGRLLASFVETTNRLLVDGEGSACAAVVARLDKLASPEKLFSAAAGIPDRPTAEMAEYHVDAVSRFLGLCLENQKPSADEIRFTSVVLARRLEELT